MARVCVCVRGPGIQCGCVLCLWTIVCCFMVCFVRGVCACVMCLRVLRVVYCDVLCFLLSLFVLVFC